MPERSKNGSKSAESSLPIEQRSRLTREELMIFFTRLQSKVWENLQLEPIPMNKLSGRASRNILIPADAPIPDCQQCGVCCVVTFDVQLTGTDRTRKENCWDISDDDSAEGINVNRVLRRDSRTGRCLSLNGEIGSGVKCGIYEQRPEACRVFDAGSDKCRALRRAKGIEPPLDIREIHRAMLLILDRETPADAELLQILDCEITREGKKGKMKITVRTEDRCSQTLHSFNAAEENWLEGDFVGLTVIEAKALIAAQPTV